MTQELLHFTSNKHLYKRGALLCHYDNEAAEVLFLSYEMTFETVEAM